MSKQHFPILAALGASAFFGFSFVFSKSALEFIAPLHLLALRFLLAASILNILRLVGLIRIDLPWKKVKALLPLGLVQPILYFLFETTGISLTSASEAGMVVALIPVATVLFAVIFLKERPTAPQLLAIGLSVAGVLLIGVMQATDEVGRNVVGLLILLGAPISGAAFSVLSRYLSKQFKPVEMTYVMMNLGALFFFTVGFGSFVIAGDMASFWEPIRNPMVVGAVGYLAIFSSIGAFFLLNFALSQLTSAQVSAFPSTTTLIAVLAALFILGESLFWFHYVGGALIVFGVWGTNYFAKRPRRQVKSVVVTILLLVGIFGLPGDAAVPDLSQLSERLDQFFPEKMGELNVPGVALAIVYDGEIVLRKGYGLADIERNVAVDPQNTVFRIASVTKLPTYVAILQLAERGLINLEDSVADYLGEGFLPLDPKLKIHHLLTHTEGFASVETPTFALSKEGIMSLEDNLKLKLHNPIVPPGSMISYTSLGAVISGYLIEKITGQSFEQYVDSNVFGPLEMNLTTASQDLPPEIADKAAITYLYDSGEFSEAPFLYSHQSPSGGISSSVEDMAIFVNALLQGEFLSADYSKRIFQRQFSGHPNLPGSTFGFLEHFQNETYALVRDGSGLGVRAQIMVVPQDNLAIVYAQNIRGDELVDQFNDLFFDTFYPTSRVLPNRAQQDLSAYEGVYRAVHYSRSYEKAGSFLYGMYMDVKDDGNGALVLNVLGPGDVAGYGGFEQGATLIPYNATLFTAEDRELNVAFRPDDAGQIKYLFSGSGYHASYEKIPWYEWPIVHGVVGALFLFLFLVSIVILGVRIKRRPNVRDVCSLLLAIFNFLFPILFLASAFLQQKAGFPIVAFHQPLLLRIVMLLPIVTTILTIAVFVWAFRTKERYLWFLGLISLLYIPFLMYWHLYPGLY